MTKLNIHEAKTHLSRYLDRVAAGEVVLLCKRNVPIAEIRPLPPQRRELQPLGGFAAEIQVRPAFFEPTPPEVISLFEGEQGVLSNS